MTAKILVTLGALGGGVVVGIIAAVAHRSQPWWGLVGSIVLVGAAALFVRAWREWLAFSVFALAWVGVVTAAAMEGPGGSVIVADDGLGKSLMLGGAVVIVAVALTPRTWIFGRSDVAH